MAHEIYENDGMVSVHERPWHGLGIVLDDHPSPKEAQVLAGLTWTVRKEAVHYRMPAIDGMSRVMQVPGAFAIVRNDNQMPLGIVGANYEPYQNDAMFSFMETFCQQAGSKIETAGSLRNGKIVWALSTAGEIEYLKGDPVQKFFLFKNGHIASVQETLLSEKKHAEAMKEVMQKMAAFSMPEAEIRAAATKIAMRDVRETDALNEGQDLFEAATAHQKKAVEKILELHESGAGSDILGVRGTAYGLLQACTEYADHFKSIRPGDRSYNEARFESLMMGGAHEFKIRAFDYAYALVS